MPLHYFFLFSLYHWPRSPLSAVNGTSESERVKGSGEKGKGGSYRNQLLDHSWRIQGWYFFHWMKSFLWSSGIQESSAPSLVSIKSLRKVPSCSRYGRTIGRLVHFDKSRSQLDQLGQTRSWGSPLRCGEESRVRPSAFCCRPPPVSWVWYQN